MGFGRSERAGLTRSALARSQGLFNLLGGAWPIVHRRSFEWIYGKKHEVFLQKTVAGLLVSIGYVQMRAETDDEIALARTLGIATAATLLLIDLVYIPKGEMRKTYLQDLVMEAGWLAAWSRT